MVNLSKTPRCAAYLKAMRVDPNEEGMNEYWAALCVAESFSEKALKKFGGINFHTMKGPRLLERMEEFLAARSERTTQAVEPKRKISPLDAITAAVSEESIVAAMTPKGGWKAKTLAAWGVSWPPPRGWREKLVANHKAQALPASAM